jgi:hypothetical protein
MKLHKIFKLICASVLLGFLIAATPVLHVEAQTANQCNDGLDNDGDGKADYGGGDKNNDGVLDMEPDPSCFSQTATTELKDDVAEHSLIPCTDKCTFTDIFRLFNKIVTFFFTVLLIPLFIIMIMYAGYQYITAQGNPSKVANLKRMAGNMLKGIVLILCAWLIVRTILVYVINDKFDENHGLIFFETVKGE